MLRSPGVAGLFYVPYQPVAKAGWQEAVDRDEGEAAPDGTAPDPGHFTYSITKPTY